MDGEMEMTMRTWTVWIPKNRQEMPRVTGVDQELIEYAQQEAETLEVSGGALIFRAGGEIVSAWGPGAWETVEPT